MQEAITALNSSVIFRSNGSQPIELNFRVCTQNTAGNVDLLHSINKTNLPSLVLSILQIHLAGWTVNP